MQNNNSDFHISILHCYATIYKAYICSKYSSLLTRYSVNMSHPDLPRADMKEFMEKSLSQMCQQLTHVVEDQFDHLKRELSADNSATLQPFTSKKARLDKPQFKSKATSSNTITNFPFWKVSTTLPRLSSIKTSIKLLASCKKVKPPWKPE